MAPKKVPLIFGNSHIATRRVRGRPSKSRCKAYIVFTAYIVSRHIYYAESPIRNIGVSYFVHRLMVMPVDFTIKGITPTSANVDV